MPCEIYTVFKWDCVHMAQEKGPSECVTTERVDDF